MTLKRRLKTSTVAGGRVGVYVPDHPRVNNRGYIPRSRFVIESDLGRFLQSDEEVHHIDGNKLNDRLENLVVLSKVEHAKLHGKDRRVLDYSLLAMLREAGLGYKKIAKKTGYPLSSVKSACRVIVREQSLEQGGERI